MKFSHFVKQAFIGGVLVIAPVVILLLIFRWVFTTISATIRPLTAPILQWTAAPGLAVDLLVILLILALCFLVGTVVSTGTGRWLHARFDSYFARVAPGYNLIKDIIQQLLGGSSESVFKRGDVALVRLFADSPVAATAIVTSRHPDGWFTVFIPTGPNPTSGLIYHLPPAQVDLRPDIKVDAAFRTIIACGAGSGELFARPREEQAQ